MRWLYVKLGITSTAAAAAATAGASLGLIGDSGTAHADHFLDSQLEMSDYVATGSSDTRMHGVGKLKGAQGRDV